MESAHRSAEDIVLPLFQGVSASVPAYQDFLAGHGVLPESVRTWEDFRRLPFITKENYIHLYPLPMLCYDGKLDQCSMVAVSSGSTGRPMFWPRRMQDEVMIARRFEQIFRDSFQAHTRSTLAVNCFTLGNWVGGMYSYNCCRYLSAKGYRITSVTPGSHKTEIFRCLKDLASHFDQTVLLGYPPFLKDVVDSGIADGFDWSAYHIRLILAGEGFSEEWRTLMGERTGSTEHCFDSASVYGTADAGVLGNETPLSILIRRFMSEHPDIARQLFGESRLPTLVQYEPASRFFETHENTLLFSGNNGIPLVRYHIADTGGLFGYKELLDRLAGYGFDPISELKRLRPEGVNIHPLPFVYVFGRSNFVVSYFGANIFPENIAIALEQPPAKDWVTGKFVMQSQEDQARNRYLSITVELNANQKPEALKAAIITESILFQLRRLNSEFANYVPEAFQRPKVTLLPFGDPDYFPAGIKHRYTR